MKLMICGHARHGKDTFCELLGLKFASSSWVALEKVIWPEMGWMYDSLEECFNDRMNHRAEWHNLITAYNTPDLTRLSRDIFADNDVYCGIRNREEFYAAKEQGLFQFSVWVDASERHPPEDEGSCKLLPSDCDIIISNNGTLDDLKAKADSFKRMIFGLKKPIGQVIIEWADQVFPDRTITNAIQKMVLEEIPEYLMNQRDPMELADLGILLYDIANLAGVDLDSAMREKMEINKNREWAINPETGLMKHV